jgi:hypothetical protein
MAAFVRDRPGFPSLPKVTPADPAARSPGELADLAGQSCSRYTLHNTLFAVVQDEGSMVWS